MSELIEGHEYFEKMNPAECLGAFDSIEGLAETIYAESNPVCLAVFVDEETGGAMFIDFDPEALSGNPGASEAMRFRLAKTGNKHEIDAGLTLVRFILSALPKVERREGYHTVAIYRQLADDRLRYGVLYVPVN